MNCFLHFELCGLSVAKVVCIVSSLIAIDSCEHRLSPSVQAQTADYVAFQEKSAQLQELIDNSPTNRPDEKLIEAPSQSVDHVLFRRVTLDLVGRIPSEREAREFLSDQRSEKYVRLVDRLLASPEFYRFLAVRLRRQWLPQLETQQYSHLITEYQQWLAASLATNARYDQLVYQQLTSPISSAVIAIDPDEQQVGSPVFLAVADMEPTRLAANSARAFLGLNIDCAQCHDHPFSRWSREQFWQTAAFFSRSTQPTKEDSERFNWCIQIEGTEQTVEAAFLDQRTTALGTSEESVFDQGRRTFADWMIDLDNPYFSRNAVNRVWCMLMGQPLASPIDDLTEADRSSGGPLLAQLAKEFQSAEYQLVPLIRAIVLSDAYQKIGGDQNEADLASRNPRLIGSVQLVNSLRCASGLRTQSPDEIQQTGFAKEFVIDDPSTSLRSTVQALMMMNGELVNRVCDPSKSPCIQTLSQAPYLSADDRIDTLFLRTLSRFPTDEERIMASNFLEADSADHAQGEKLGELFWALLNSAEFHIIQ